MPKESSKPRGPRKFSSTGERRARAARVRSNSKEMVFRCKRCDEKNLRCFVDTATGRCAGCISVAAECSLFVSEEEWEKVEKEKQEKRLAIARIKAQLAQSELELLEIESREQKFARRDLAVLQVQESGEASTTTALPTTDSSADPGWSQALDPLLDPSLDQFLNNFFVDPSADFGFLSPSFLGEFAGDTVPLAGDSS